eukprot:g17090.t1
MATRTHTTAVLGGETASLLDAPRSLPQGDPYSRAFETGRGGGGYEVIEERTGGGPEGPPDLSLDGFQSYHAQPSSSMGPSSTYSRALPPLPERHRGATSSSGSKRKAKTRFPSLTPSTTPSLAPAPGNFSASGDTRAAEAVAHARKTWAPPALRTQAIASYGAVPDLEIIPENIEVDRFQKRQRIGAYSDLGCPAQCVIS